jgi:hypothetical protein
VTSVPLFVTVPVVPVVSTAVTVSVSRSASVSLPTTSTVSPVESSETLGVSSTAFGTSLTELTVMVTVAGGESECVSFAVYVNVSVPWKFASGSYSNEPSAARVTVPCGGLDALPAVIGSASGSVSFARTPVRAGTDRCVSSFTEYASSLASGGWLVAE